MALRIFRIFFLRKVLSDLFWTFVSRKAEITYSSHLFTCSFCNANLFQFWLKVELLLSPDDALPQVLESGAALFGRPTKVNDVVHVRLALHGLGDVLVKLLNHLEVTEPVLLFKELFLVWELILISLKPIIGKYTSLQWGISGQNSSHLCLGITFFNFSEKKWVLRLP